MRIALCTIILSSILFLTPVGVDEGISGIAGHNIAIAKVPVLDVRKSPSDSSELVTQVLYNERLLTYEENGKWTRVIVPDQYRTQMAVSYTHLTLPTN